MGVGKIRVNEEKAFNELLAQDMLCAMYLF